MMFSNVSTRPLALSKISDLFSGGWGRTDAPHVKPPIDAPKVGDGSTSNKIGEGDGSLDQKFIDQKVSEANGTGQVTGTRPSGEADIKDTPGVAQYKQEQHKKWLAQHEAKIQKKLQGEPTRGRVGGEDAESFSSSRLSSEAASLSESAKLKAEKAAPARTSTLLRTAAIAAPFSVLALTAAGTANAFVNKSLNAGNLTKTDFKNAQIVEQSKKDVFVAANAWSDLKGHQHVAPDLSWALKDDDERMDLLEEMVDILEAQLAVEAKARGIPVTFATVGAVKDDIESRATAINSRLATITLLFRHISSALKAETA